MVGKSTICGLESSGQTQSSYSHRNKVRRCTHFVCVYCSVVEAFEIPDYFVNSILFSIRTNIPTMYGIIRIILIIVYKQ